MANLRAWQVTGDGSPVEVHSGAGLLEKRLEDWIQSEPSMLGRDIRWVSRQLVLPDQTRLDLLGITPDGIWVIAELKRGAPDGGAVRQALHYMSVLDELTNVDLISRVRGQAGHIVDPEAEKQLDSILTLDDDERDYRFLVAGIGDGRAAERAAWNLARHGLAVDVDVVTFTLFFDGDDRYTLVREVDEETTIAESAAGHTLEGLLDAARRFGVLTEFEAIRHAVLNRGYRSWQRKHGINFNTGSRRQVLWIAPQQGGIHIGCLTSNFPLLYGVPEEEVTSILGPNWVTLDGATAVERVAAWLDSIDAMRAQWESATS